MSEVTWAERGCIGVAWRCPRLPRITWFSSGLLKGSLRQSDVALRWLKIT